MRPPAHLARRWLARIAELRRMPGMLATHDWKGPQPGGCGGVQHPFGRWIESTMTTVTHQLPLKETFSTHANYRSCCHRYLGDSPATKSSNAHASRSRRTRELAQTPRANRQNHQFNHQMR